MTTNMLLNNKSDYQGINNSTEPMKQSQCTAQMINYNQTKLIYSL
jgi:hypothetical protein